MLIDIYTSPRKKILTIKYYVGNPRREIIKAWEWAIREGFYDWQKVEKPEEIVIPKTAKRETELL